MSNIKTVVYFLLIWTSLAICCNAWEKDQDSENNGRRSVYQDNVKVFLKRHPWKDACSDVTFTCGSGSGYTKACFCIGRTCPDGCDSDSDCCTTTVDGIRYVGYCLERYNSAYCRYRRSF
jgi:hypothetical protein